MYCTDIQASFQEQQLNLIVQAFSYFFLHFRHSVLGNKPK